VIPLVLIAVVLVAFALAANNVIPLFAAVGIILVALLAVAWVMDRRAGPGGHRMPPKGRPSALLGMGAAKPMNYPVVPLDRPDGAGEPPGVNRGGDSLPH
jgi:hypothetical protein